jgi:hypothetical protein
MMRMPARITGRTSTRRRIANGVLAIALVVPALMTAVVPASHAQGDALLSVSTVAPADTVFYAEALLDSSSEQLVLLDEILLKLGSESSLIDEIEQATAENDGVSLDGSEIALAVLPSALEAASAASDVVSEVSSSGDVDMADEAATDLASTASDQGILLIFNSPEVDELEADALESAGPSADREEYLGIEIVSDGEESWFARIDDFFVVGPALDDVKSAIDASTDGGSSLAGVDEFREASDLLPATRFAYAFANGPVVLENLPAEMGEDPMFAEIFGETVESYNGFMGLTVAADEAGIRVETVTIPMIAVPAVTTPAGDLTMADRMPSNTVIFANGQDLGQTTLMNGVGILIVTALGTLTAEPMDNEPIASPVPMTIDEMYESLAQLFGFNLKTEFIDQLVGEYGFGVWGVDNGDPTEIGAVLVSGADDAELLGDTVSSVSFLIQAGGQGELNVTSRPIEGGPINNVHFNAEGVPVSIDFGVVGDEFILGLNDGADMVTSGPTDSLSDSPVYQNAMSLLPEEHASIYFVNVAALTAASASLPETDLDESTEDMFVEVPVQSVAAVTWVEDGNSRTSAVVVVP